MKLYGVFIGIDEYKDKRIHNLRFARADAIKFEQLVKASFPQDEIDTFLLTDSDATRSEILRTIGVEVAESAALDDMVFIHFSGHGSPEIESRIDEASRYLIPHDALYDNIFGTAIDIERDLKRMLERIRAKLIIVFVDACFSGMAGGRTFEGPNLQRVRSKFRPLISLKKMNLGQGRIIIAAADDTEVALEEENLGHGIFSYVLFNILTDPQSPDKTISITTLYDHVAEQVRKLSSGHQTPILNGRSRLGRIPKFLGNSKAN